MSISILSGDCRDILPTLAADSFDCIVTSPPYFGLRDYGVEGQIGLELTMADYLETMVGVCREIRRVLRPSGTFWLNIGDSYAGSGKGGNPGNSPHVKQKTNSGSISVRGVKRGDSEFDAKQLMMVPNRLAIALQDDGWWVRSEIIWAKPNPMPESVRDRPTCAHEKVWLLTKSDKYFYDGAAIAEPAIYSGLTGQDESGFKNAADFNGKHAASPEIRGERKSDKQRGHSRRHAGFNDRWDEMTKAEQCSGTRNARNVWAISPQPFKGSHFATMPPELAERCIRAGSPNGGSVLDPFGGAGTTGLVADRLGRHATLIEINPAYGSMSHNRIADDAPLFTRVAAQKSVDESETRS